MKSLKSDVSAVSELVMILVLIVVVLVVVGLLFGGIALTLGVFFAGKLGLGFALLVLGIIVFGVTLVPQLHIPKTALWLAYLFIGAGLLLAFLGVLGF